MSDTIKRFDFVVSHDFESRALDGADACYVYGRVTNVYAFGEWVPAAGATAPHGVVEIETSLRCWQGKLSSVDGLVHPPVNGLRRFPGDGLTDGIVKVECREIDRRALVQISEAMRAGQLGRVRDFDAFIRQLHDELDGCGIEMTAAFSVGETTEADFWAAANLLWVLDRHDSGGGEPTRDGLTVAQELLDAYTRSTAEFDELIERFWSIMHAQDDAEAAEHAAGWYS